MFVPQRFTVGVVVAYPTGGFSYRLISDLTKFECVYGRKGSALVRSLVESAEFSLARAAREDATIDAITFQTGCVITSVPWATSGKSPEHVLSRLFLEVVMMEPTS